MIIDFHSHILPGMDDGSKSTEESLMMLRESASQGITHMVATSHFYAGDESPDEFIARRNESLAILREGLEMVDFPVPEIIPGAEVLYFGGISNTEEILKLRLEGTNVLLVEMPFSNWTKNMIYEIIDINNRRDVQVVIAHMDRYLNYSQEWMNKELRRNDVLFQFNAEFFREGLFSRKCFRFCSDGMVNLLGSDCHNTGSRPQNLGNARKLIEKHVGRDCLYHIDSIGEWLITAPGLF